MRAVKPLVIFVAFWLISCSAIKSVVAPTELDGLVYYMPMKDLLVTVVQGEAKAPTVTVDVTKAYADRTKPYVLRHGINAFGKNTLDIVITERGLLSSAKSTTISTVGEALKSLGASAGSISTLMMDASPTEKPEVCAEGTHTFVYAIPDQVETQFPCGLPLQITPLTGTLAEAVKSAIETKAVPAKDKPASRPGGLPATKPAGVEYSGVFYRQELPYLVTIVSGTAIHQASIVYSPSRSETRFLPASETFFSNNKAEFEFTDGVPKKYLQETEGEGTALFKIPAEVLSAYFGAIGTMFDAFKSNDSKQADFLAQSLKLELMKRKYEACLAAIAAGETEKVKELGCSQQ